MPAAIAWNRRPLPKRLLSPLPLSAVLPAGRLRSAVTESPAHALDERLAKAYLLQDQALLERASAEVAAILEGDAPPDRFALRALLRYHGASNDRRVLTCLLAYAKSLQSPAFSPEAAADIGDLLRALLWLYNLTGQAALLELCRKLKAQAPDWMSTFHVFPATKPVKDASAPGTDAYCRVHGATVASSLKTPALQSLFEGGLKNETAFAAGWDKLIRYHGAAHGLFNADPLLAGANPSRTVDPETVSELLYTLETLLWAQGDPSLTDPFETVAFGALPASYGPLAANQLTERASPRADGAAAFAASQWMATSDDGLAAVGYSPCSVRWRAGGQTVRVDVESDYPYADTALIRLSMKEPCRFPLRLRTPAWAENATVTVNGEDPDAMVAGFTLLEREWRSGDTLNVRLPSAVRVRRAHHQSLIVSRGPLTYALPLSEGSPWRYALLPEKGFLAEREKGVPTIVATAVPFDGWLARKDQPAPPPITPMVDASRACAIRLVPFGETKRRIAQFPEGKTDA